MPKMFDCHPARMPYGARIYIRKQYRSQLTTEEKELLEKLSVWGNSSSNPHEYSMYEFQHYDNRKFQVAKQALLDRGWEQFSSNDINEREAYYFCVVWNLP